MPSLTMCLSASAIISVCKFSLHYPHKISCLVMRIKQLYAPICFSLLVFCHTQPAVPILHTSPSPPLPSLHITNYLYTLPTTSKQPHPSCPAPSALNIYQILLTPDYFRKMENELTLTSSLFYHQTRICGKRSSNQRVHGTDLPSTASELPSPCGSTVVQPWGACGEPGGPDSY